MCTIMLFWSQSADYVALECIHMSCLSNSKAMFTFTQWQPFIHQILTRTVQFTCIASLVHRFVSWAHIVFQTSLAYIHQNSKFLTCHFSGEEKYAKCWALLPRFNFHYHQFMCIHMHYNSSRITNSQMLGTVARYYSVQADSQSCGHVTSLSMYTIQF